MNHTCERAETSLVHSIVLIFLIKIVFIGLSYRFPELLVLKNGLLPCRAQKNFAKIQKFSVFKCLYYTTSIFCDGNLFKDVFICIQTCFNYYPVEFSLFPDFIDAFVRLGGRFCEF